jgi:threonylcarbamoyladenosine tRNA methylthiotransferase MtaB
VALAGHSAKTRAFLKIQEGCNAFCTYCVIPYGRGPSRSIKPGEVIRQIQELVEQGIQEVVITGTNVGDYGTDWGSETSKISEELVSLFEMIFAETSLKRLRVSSLDPVEITPDLMNLMRREPRFCPHFHVSLQSPHTRILKMMKRKYTSLEVKSCLEAIEQIGRKSDAPLGGVFVGMDVITGFPGESDEDFEQSYEMLASLPWSRLHVFPYSERNGTPATRLPDSVPWEVRTQRAKKLNALSLQRIETFYQNTLAKSVRTGQGIESVLLERIGSDTMRSGYSANYLRVMVPTEQAQGLENTVVRVKPVEVVLDEAAGDAALICTVL